MTYAIFGFDVFINSPHNSWTKSNLVSLPWHTITGGKPITPNDVTDSLSNGHTTENGAVAETVTKSEVSIDFYYTFPLSWNEFSHVYVFISELT